jgi:hypothetical protein
MLLAHKLYYIPAVGMGTHTYLEERISHIVNDSYIILFVGESLTFFHWISLWKKITNNYYGSFNPVLDIYFWAISNNKVTGSSLE